MRYEYHFRTRRDPDSFAGQSLGSELLDISPDFEPNETDARIIRRIIKLDKTPEAIKAFAREHSKLTDYGYWFLLGTLWVSYSGWSDLQQWKYLFASSRPRRESSLMKPSELAGWNLLPETMTLYRAHRPGEEDWISYSLERTSAERFALQRGVTTITEYRVSKSDALCVLLRRVEAEVLVLDRRKASIQRNLHVRGIAGEDREVIP